MKIAYILASAIWLSTLSYANNGKQVFETYCWGCHHQTAEAFGPSFSKIANLRNPQTIRAMISNPQTVSKTLGYKRNAMPAFKLKEDEIKAITAYIFNYKDSNQTKGGI